MLHDPGGFATQEPAIQKLDNYYSDSNNTSSSSEVSPLSKVPRVTSERKAATMTTTTTNHNHRRSSDRAKDLHKLNAPQLIGLVLHLESQLDKTDTRLKKYVLRCKEHVESETQASEQAKKFRQKMTQVILNAQQEAARAKLDVEEYKLRFENVQKDLQRSREVVQILENDKDEIQRALHHARDRAREYKEQSAVQLAREQGRRVGFEQGLEQGRLAVQLAHARAIVSALPAPTHTTTSSRTAPRRRRALTQGTDGATTAPTTPTTRQRRRQSQPQPRTDSFPSQHGRRSSLDSIPETTRLDGAEPTSSRSRPSSQAQTDGGRSNASGPREQNSEHRPSNSGPAPPAPPVVQPIPPIPPPQQFPAGVPRDDVSEATTSPASTMTGMDILTFREAPVVSTSPTSSPEIRRSRGGQTNAPTAEDAIRGAPTFGGHPPPGRTAPSTAPPVQPISHDSPPGITIEPPPPHTMAHPVQQQPPFGFQPDENLLTPTFLPSQTLPRSTSTHSLTQSNRSSFSFDINVESPSQPSTPRESDESSSNQDGHYLSPNGSRPISLPPVRPQPHHESPVLPVLPRIVSQPTEWGTPAVRPLDFASGYSSTGNDGPVYEEAPTPPGFHYPAPLGAAISGGLNVVNGKGKGKSGTIPQSPAGGSSLYYASSPYVSKSDSSSSQQPIVPPVVPKTSSSSSSSSSTSSLQPVVPPVIPKTTPSLSSSSTSSSQPVVPPVTPNVGIYQGSQPTGVRGNGYHRNGRDNDDDDLEEDTSFDSATKRNTQWNSRMYRQGKWGE